MLSSVQKMTKDDINTLILFSFRYAIDRKTGDFADVCSIIKRNKIPDWVRDQLIRDCERSIAFKDFEKIDGENFRECEKLLVFLRGSEGAEKTS